MPLSDTDRFRLFGGSYCAPKCRIGDWLTCQIRGRVRVVAMSDGPIPWPMVVKTAAHWPPAFALCGDLVQAVRQESTQAIQHWWGVKSSTVWRWRKALGVDPNNAGTRKLRSIWWTEGGTGEASRPNRMASLSSPERRAKIAAAKRENRVRSTSRRQRGKRASGERCRRRHERR